MAIAFPSTPSVNDIFSSGAKSWVWTGTVWASRVSTNPWASGVWISKTSAYNAVSMDSIFADTAGGPFTITLPASPSFGNTIIIADKSATWATNNLTIGRNGATIEGSASDLVVDSNSHILTIIYNGVTWRVYIQ